MDKIENLIKTFKAGKWEEGESAFLTLLENGKQTTLPLKEITLELVRRGQQKRAIDLLGLTAAGCSEGENPALWVESLRLLAEYSPFQKGLMQEYARAFARLHDNRPYLSLWIKKILEKKPILPNFIATLDKLVLFKEGTVVKHKSGWGIGRVVSIDEESMMMVLDLQRRPNHAMDILAASDCLVTMDAQHFEAMVVYNLEQLKKEAEDEPLKLMHRLLKFAQEPISSKEIKQYLHPNIIDEKSWNKWWGKVRKLMMSDSFIDVSADTHSRYKLREKPVEWEDEVYEGFDKADPIDRPSIVSDYIKNSNDKKQLEYFTKSLNRLMEEWLKENKIAQSFECYLVIQECEKLRGEKGQEMMPVFQRAAVDIFVQLRLPNLAQQTFDLFLKNGEWQKHIETVFKKGSDLARDTFLRYLIKENLVETHFKPILESILRSPLASPDALAWISKQILQEKIPSIPEIPNIAQVFQTLIYTGTTLKSLRQTDSVKKINKLFSVGLVKKIAHCLEKEQALELFRLVSECAWITASFKQSLKDAIQETFPDLFKKQELPIYTTQEGLERYQEEMQDLLNHKIPKNSKDIGDALAFGDISENAELDAAREIQFQLMKKLEEMKNNLRRASVIDFEKVNTDAVSIGTSVVLEDEKKERVSYTILGPWDVNLEEGRISFMSLIGEVLLGKPRGAEVKFPTGVYKIVDIQKYQRS